MDKYEEQILIMVSSGRISTEDAKKLLNIHHSNNSRRKSFYGAIKKDVAEKFRYLVTLELPEEEEKKRLPQILFETFETSQKAKTLSLSAFNGHLNVRKTLEGKLLIKVGYRKKSENALLNLSYQGDILSLNYNEKLFESVSIDAQVPKYQFGDLSLTATHGRITFKTHS